MTVYVGNLSYKASEEDLKNLFSKHGVVNRISIPTDRDNADRKRGFAFVELVDENKERDAIAALNGLMWMGRELKVNLARPKERRQRRNFEHSDKY